MKMLLLPLVISAVVIPHGWSHDTPVPHETSVKPHPTIKYEKKSIDEIMNESKDSELVKLSGEIIKKLKCNTYLFRDESGQIRIHIEDDDIPRKGLLFNSPVIINGEIEKNKGKPARIEASKVKYVF